MVIYLKITTSFLISMTASGVLELLIHLWNKKKICSQQVLIFASRDAAEMLLLCLRKELGIFFIFCNISEVLTRTSQTQFLRHSFQF